MSNNNLNNAFEDWFIESDASVSTLEEKRQLQEAFEAGQATSQWLPISTVPKDGTDVLLFHSKDEVLIGHWSKHSVWLTRGGYGYLSDYITHWMPLPAPPLPIGAQGSEE